MTAAPNAAKRLWDAASPAQREELRGIATRRIADRRAHPLAYAQLWHSENTSQRYVLANLAEDATLVTGGNGAGKTLLGGMVAVAVLLGRNHPDVQRWFALNPSIDQSFFPPDGAPVIASSLNSAMSVDIQRAMVALFVPPDEVKWRNEAAPGVSSVQVKSTKHKMVFLTNDAGWKKFQGYRGALVWLDEEHDEAVYNECLQRISRVKWEGRSGWILKTMTPLQGLTWVHRRFVKEPDDGTIRHHLWGEDNPHLDQEKRERILKSYGAHERASRDKGVFVVLEGRVFIEWDRAIHVVPSFTPPADWMRFNGWDFGTRNPTAIHWLAHDESDNVLHVYREHYKAEKSLKWHAGQYHLKCGNGWEESTGTVIYKPTAEDIEFVCCDSAGRGDRISLAQDYDIPNVPSFKGAGSVRAGINAIAARLTPDANGRPHIVVHDCCVHLISEIEGYRWDTTSKKGDDADAPLKKDDHAIDDVRYAVTYFERSGYA